MEVPGVLPPPSPLPMPRERAPFQVSTVVKDSEEWGPATARKVRRTPPSLRPLLPLGVTWGLGFERLDEEEAET